MGCGAGVAQPQVKRDCVAGLGCPWDALPCLLGGGAAAAAPPAQSSSVGLRRLLLRPSGRARPTARAISSRRSFPSRCIWHRQATRRASELAALPVPLASAARPVALSHSTV
jgi:hypothetical protein